MSFLEESKKRFDEKFCYKLGEMSEGKQFMYLPSGNAENMRAFIVSEIQRFANEAIERMEKEKRGDGSAQGNIIWKDWDDAISKAPEIIKQMKS